MPTVDQRTRDLNRHYHKQNNLDYIPATVIQRTVNGITSIYDPTRPGNVWVAQPSSNGLQLPPSVRPPQQQGVQLDNGSRVVLKYDAQGELFIDGYDTRGMLASGQPAVPLPAPVRADQTSIQTLTVVPSNPPSMVLSAKAWNPIKGNKVTLMPGVTWSAISAPSAGQMYLAVLFVKDDQLTGEITYSTARGQTDTALGQDDINEALATKSIGSTPAWAQKIIGGQTTIAQADLDADGWPLQQLVNTDDDTYHATVSTTDATVTTLWSLTCPASTTVSVRGRITARRTGGSAGTAEDGAYYDRSVAVKNITGTATVIGAVATTVTAEDQAGWDCTFDVTGATVRCRVTGATNNNIDWAGTFEVEQAS